MMPISANPAVHKAIAQARVVRGNDVASFWRWMTFSR